MLTKRSTVVDQNLKTSRTCSDVLQSQFIASKTVQNSIKSLLYEKITKKRQVVRIYCTKLEPGATPPRRFGKRRSLPDTLPSQEPPRKRQKRVTYTSNLFQMHFVGTEVSGTKYEIELNEEGIQCKRCPHCNTLVEKDQRWNAFRTHLHRHKHKSAL